MGDMMTFPASVEEFMEQYKMTDTEQFFLCNRCKKKEYWESNYCPNCGCRMDGGAE